MKQRYFIVAILLAACFCSLLKAEPVDLEVSKRISRMERYIYGAEQDASNNNRLKQIEEDLFGRTTGQSDSEKSKTPTLINIIMCIKSLASADFRIFAPLPTHLTRFVPNCSAL